MKNEAVASPMPATERAKQLGFLERYSAIMRPSDAADLRWYCASGGFGVFSPSPTAALMATLEMYAKVAVPCVKCGGDKQSSTPGCGFVSSKPKGRDLTPYELEMLKLLDIYPDAKLPPPADRECPACRGFGWIVGAKRPPSGGMVTARPTGSSKSNAMGVSVSDGNITRLGLVSRRLSAVGAVAPVARVALESYYAPDGGDAGALWHLVPSGKTMLKANANRLPWNQFFANVRAQQSEKPTEKRASQIKAATEQATELYTLACRSWNSVVEPRRFKAEPHEDAQVFPAVDVDANECGDES